MKTMKKLKNKKGFTLMEMLLVVAIMVILVSVSIPVVTSQLNKAKKTTDDANLRAAKSVALSAVMLGEPSLTSGMVYDISEGAFIEASAKQDSDKGQSSENKDRYIVLTIDADGNASVAWGTVAAGGSGD